MPYPPGYAIVTALLLAAWLGLLPPFYAIALHATQNRRPETPRNVAHNIAFACALVWPAAMVLGLIRATMGLNRR